jgi:uncharacterized protein (TIGR03435 family)
MNAATYDIEATLPPNTTKEDFRLMLQRLLVDRLGLVVHHESREQTVFDLVIAKGGPRLHDPAPAAPSGAGAETQPPNGARPVLRATRDKDGNLQLPPGHPSALWAQVGGGIRLMGRMQGMADIVRMLEDQVQIPIFDKTGLAGTYDYTLDYTPDDGVTRNGVPVAAREDTDPGGLFHALPTSSD